MTEVQTSIIGEAKRAVFTTPGRCTVCLGDVIFSATGTWLRDELFCPNCRSLPRERALFHVLRTQFPTWTSMAIHESSPGTAGASRVLRENCAGYVPSYYFPGKPLGAEVSGFRNENLEELTFGDARFDLHITQDVMEHVLDPDRAFAELARTLKTGGAHVFTTPIVNGGGRSVVRARHGQDGGVEKLLPDVYHGDPINSAGTLVTVDWGLDICERIFTASGMFTVVFAIQDPSMGVLGAYTEVLVSRQFCESPHDRRSS